VRCENHAALKELLEAALRKHSAQHWLDALKRSGIPCGPMNDVAAVRRDRRCS
jgi:CoA:oxalate CoA-transferase